MMWPWSIPAESDTGSWPWPFGNQPLPAKTAEPEPDDAVERKVGRPRRDRTEVKRRRKAARR